jgi:hypothetical protein
VGGACAVPSNGGNTEAVPLVEGIWRGDS